MQDAVPLTPGFMIVHGNRLEDLRSLAVSWMRSYPLSPLENENILVQSNGIAQWLKLALAEDPREDGEGGCGIAAALDVQLPSAFLWRVYRQVLGRDTVPESSPLDRTPLIWRLMRLLPGLLHKPSFASLRRFLDDDSDMRKRYQLAERLADLYDQYQVYRADWLEDWASGKDQLNKLRDGAVSIPEACQWQAELWRALLDDVGDDGMEESRAGVHQRFITHMKTVEEAPARLPRRVVVFGISSIPAQTLEALAALARFSQVLLCVHNPCRHHWGDIVADKDLLKHEYRRHLRKPGMPMQIDPDQLHQHGHPLLASWGKQGRDYINLLDSFDEPNGYRSLFADVNGGRIDLFDEVEPAHMLAQLQDDILNLRPLNETRETWPEVDPAQDASIRFHIAHSPQREVEILHDQLLARFSKDPTLRPRDIIVMVPDIDAYAPHIRAVFGQLDTHDSRFIPFTLADQGQRGRDPLLIALEHLLRLPESRFSVSEILDLLDVPALRKRFGLDDSDLTTLHRWIEGAGIRWGLDARQRARLDLPDDLNQNTWRFGLRRMLLGYAVGRGVARDEIEPFDEIGGLDAALVGPLVTLMDALDRAHDELGQPASPPVWGDRLQSILRTFFLATNERDEYLLGQLEQLRETWLDTCEAVQLADELPLTVVREAWLAGLDEGKLSQRFLAGAVNFCTLMPMRAIPFRMVCLLGMNDGDYPRAQAPFDFDLMGKDYRPGDRSRREDDRYLLLEALLSARDYLYMSWIGRSIRDNSERPASVLLGQLRDHLAAGWKLKGGGKLLHALTQEHPLQPFSIRYFQGDPALFSYAREWLALHETPREMDEEAKLPPHQQDEPLSLHQLQDFLRHPARHFFTQRLKVHFDEVEIPAQNAEPFVLDGFTRYALSESLLDAALKAMDNPEDALRAQAQRLQRSGLLPLAGFGELLQAELIQPMPDLVNRLSGLLVAWPEEIASAQALHFEHEGLRLEGWLEQLRGRSDGSLIAITPLPNDIGKDKARKWYRLIRPWIVHLTASACGIPLTTALVATDETLLLAPLDAGQVEKTLRHLLTSWQAGMRYPLPVAVKTAFAWLSAGNDPGKAEAAALKAYEGDGVNSFGERAESPALLRHYPDFSALMASEEFEGWCDTLYRPLFEAGWEAVPASVPAQGATA
ncbi:DNA helicase/exodeoxyribonuclease V gamma subunit [Pseudomonas duriflava]|uniref:RecBCD enzyme subunit RecC n=1 Tax=Pseudomonas duriflava TaxID=459528 RepID=A0A562QPG2_9PSED|nr:exodeoxyribonuclease V subunit gamma [Pseudomonas duriflava]TWI58639.1 DNA helicase/exodeoxyribonuclease V gamma subunit [Pseudomonas duriflava]